MKALEIIHYGNDTLAVLMDELPQDKAAISYFINGFEVTDFGVLQAIYQNLFTAMSDSLCTRYSLQKWSY